MGDSDSRRIPLSDVFTVFLRLGLTAFGGLGASLAVIEIELVERRRLLTSEDLSEALAATKLLPGSTLLQLVSYLAYRLGGWCGSVLATLAFLLPSAFLMLVFAIIPIALMSSPVVASLVHGLSLAVVGLLLASILRLARGSLRSPLAAGIALGAFAAGSLSRFPTALIVAAAGLIGLVMPPTGGTGQGGIKTEAAE
jgi:chromate transporter